MTSSLDSTTPQNPKREKVQKQKAERDFLALLNLGSIAIQGISLLVMLLLFVTYWKLSSRPVPSLVQLANGTAVTTRALGNKERSREVIQRFTTDSLTLLMSWQQQIPSAEVTPDGRPVLVNDPGMKVKVGSSDGLITSRSYQASFAFSEEFRNDLITLLGSMTPPSVFTGQTQTALVFRSVTEPEEIKEGEWRIAVVGNLIQSNVGEGTTKTIFFNKEILLRAIDTPELPANGQFASPFEAAVYAVRQSGLEIYSMKDLEFTGGQ